MTDDMGLIADVAIIALGVEARRVEAVAFDLENSPARDQLVDIAERMRDVEELLRQRIKKLARES
ncbi:MAG: hypothetical protein ABS87_00895 [Sphingomonas sp. SCN 67-18]|nr:hypothetical protein [Sphingomonas sp. SCN 67-18]ODU22755.1 MAG: hypothetical protein ABS87_00895 [Sphingomonas sp. SCN 67-18]